MEAINEIIFFASLAFLLGAVIADQWHRKARKENTARIDAICERVKLMTDHNYALAWEKLMMELVGEDRQENVRSVIKIMQGKLQARDQEIQDIRTSMPIQTRAQQTKCRRYCIFYWRSRMCMT